MKHRKSVGMIISVIMLLTMFMGAAGVGEGNFNPTGFPIVNEPIEKTFIIRKQPNIGDVNQMPTLKLYEEMTNVKINWEIVSADGFTERVNLAMASKSMPDAIIKGVPNVTKCAADGSIIDLTDLIDQYGDGLKALFEQYPELRSASKSPDGNIYTFPFVNVLRPNRTGHRNIWINQTWLDALGLKMPTTADEYLDVLRAFRDGDPNGNGDTTDEIPYIVEDSTGLRNARPDIISSFFGLYSNFGYENMMLDGDTVKFLPTNDLRKEVLQYMNIMYSERLLDPEVFTQSPDASLGKYSSGIGGSFGLSSNDLFTLVAEHYVAMPPVTALEGREPVIGLGSTYAGQGAVITSADQTPEITLRWIDYFYTLEGSMLVGGVAPELDGITCQQYPDGTWDYTDAIYNDPRGMTVAVGEACPIPGGGFPYQRNEFNSMFIYTDKVKESVPTWEPYYQKDTSYPYPVFSVEDNERVSDIRRDLDVYVSECQSKFITGELSFDRWDEFVATCQGMGSDTLVEVFQKSYDAMK